MERINVDDELFWLKVREAYNVVASDYSKVVKFTMAHREVTVSYDDEQKDISVFIVEIELTPPTLVVP